MVAAEAWRSGTGVRMKARVRRRFVGVLEPAVLRATNGGGGELRVVAAELAEVVARCGTVWSRELHGGVVVRWQRFMAKQRASARVSCAGGEFTLFIGSGRCGGVRWSERWRQTWPEVSGGEEQGSTIGRRHLLVEGGCGRAQRSSGDWAGEIGGVRDPLCQAE